MNSLTPRQQAIYQYLKNSIQQNHSIPSFREIQSALGIGSTSTIQKEINALVDAGLLKKKGENTRRTISLTEEESAKDSASPASVTEVPVVGRIAAGTPILAEENIEDTFPVPNKYIQAGTNFMLTVHGESMVEAGIFDGDYILVHQQSDAENGQIVAAMIDGIESECTVKGFYKEAGHVRLQPYNSSMSPIIVEDCKVLGVVKGVFRYFN